jgi:hypothetical protein
MFGLGSYLGEVIVRQKGGAWSVNEADSQAEMNVQLQLPGHSIWPIQRVIKRFENGAEDGIAAHGLGLGLERRPSQRPLVSHQGAARTSESWRPEVPWRAR